MQTDFKQSATGAPSAQNQLVFVSDFQGTIEGNGVNFPLLKLLNDAKAAGHRVIFTSTAALYAVTNFLGLIPKSGERRGINLDQIQKIIDEGDVLAKYQLHELTDDKGQALEFDFVFDDNPVSYVTPKNEIRVTPPFANGGEFKTSPLTLAQIRLSFMADSIKTFTPDRKP